MSALRDWAVVVAGEETWSCRSGIGSEKRMMRGRGVREEEGDEKGGTKAEAENVSALRGIWIANLKSLR